MWTGMESTRQHEDLSSGLVPALCVTIGHQLNQFKRLSRCAIAPFSLENTLQSGARSAPRVYGDDESRALTPCP